MKIHITLKKDVDLSSVLSLFEIAGVQNINQKRFLRYGIVSGDFPPEKIFLLEAMSVVDKVTPDGEKSIS